MPQMTRSELVTRIGLLINDPSNTRFTAAQKQAEIQKAQEQFVLDTGVLKDVATIALTADTSEYALPTDILDVFRVSHNGLKLTRTSEYDLDVLYGSDWSATDGTPTQYYIDLDPNNKKIRFYPTPQAADVTAAANAYLEYLKSPPALTSDSDVPLDAHTLLAVYNDALAYWASSSLLSIRPAQTDLVMIGQYDKKYNDKVNACIERFKAMGESRPMNIYRGRNPSNLGR